MIRKIFILSKFSNFLAINCFAVIFSMIKVYLYVCCLYACYKKSLTFQGNKQATTINQYYHFFKEFIIFRYYSYLNNSLNFNQSLKTICKRTLQCETSRDFSHFLWINFYLRVRNLPQFCLKCISCRSQTETDRYFEGLNTRRGLINFLFFSATPKGFINPNSSLY